MVLTLQTIYAITDNHHKLTSCKMVLLTVSGNIPALVILDFINSSPTLNPHPVIFFFKVILLQCQLLKQFMKSNGFINCHYMKNENPYFNGS